MDDRKERILLVALNMHGNFIKISDEFTPEQQAVIFDAMDMFLDEMKDKELYYKLDEILHHVKL